MLKNTDETPFFPFFLCSTAEGEGVVNGPHHELTSFQAVNYTYINDERLKTVTSGSNTYQLAYDALGRCVKRTLNSATTYYVYDGEKPILEYNAGGTVIAANLYGKEIDEVLMRSDYSIAPTRVLYYQDDHEGSVTHLTNSAGAIIESYRYDAFGAPKINDGSITSSAFDNRFMFTGREYASAFRIYEYRARAYHPAIGRFMSEDPKLFVRRSQVGNPISEDRNGRLDARMLEPKNDKWDFSAHPDDAELNLFRYCGNDPLDFTDPDGEFALNVVGAVTGFVGGFVADVVLQGAEDVLSGKLFSEIDIDYGHAALSGGIGAIAGATGFGAIGNAKKGFSAIKKANHARKVLAARKAAQAAGKYRNAAKTNRIQREVGQHVKDAAVGAGKGSAASVVKKAVDELTKPPEPPIDNPTYESR